MKRRSQTTFSSKQNQELVWGEREEREERVGGGGGGINLPKNPLQLSTHENMYKCCMFKRQEPDC